ncbi:MAG: universal stress protein, partial [Actinomycetota bacterium]|nr:universal stress protein [Actinomycetota bacterium]
MEVFPTRILLAIADSEDADLVTHKAVSLADSTGSELHLVYVGQLPNRFMEDPDILGFNRKLY